VRAGSFYFALIGNLLENPDNGCCSAAAIISASGHHDCRAAAAGVAAICVVGVDDCCYPSASGGPSSPRFAADGEQIMSGMIGRQPAVDFLERVRRGGVFFVFPRAECELYWSSCLAEGFQELGIPIFSNFDLYPLGEAERSRWLFPRSSMPPAMAALIIGDVSELETYGKECRRVAEFVISQPQRSVLLCMADSVNTLDFPFTSPVFVAHRTDRIRPRGNLIPWAFGLNRDVLKKIDAARLHGPRRPAFIRNFRPSFSQCVRQALDLAFVKNLSKHFDIDSTIDDGGRFLPTHYSKLATSFGCLAYGGSFIEDYSRNPYLAARGHAERWIMGDYPVIIRWDSWRFWESMASGCLTVALDFNEYGLQLPVVPENGVHYIGLRFDQLSEALGVLTDDRDRLSAIAEQGRRWVIAHYAPIPTALRFLSAVEHLSNAR
jgi:hypothetical protein